MPVPPLQERQEADMFGGRTAVVSGAGGGIGRAVALRLADCGALVVATDRHPVALDDTVQALRLVSPKSRGKLADLSDPAQIGALFDGLTADRLVPDILVNNAGVSRQVSFDDLTVADIDLICAVNLRGTLLMMQRAARDMRKVGAGCIINMSSIAGKGYRNTSNIAYAASKGAIITMGRIAAAELGRHGIRVNTICPGITETPLMQDWLGRRAAAADRPVGDLRKDMAAASALGRINTPEDIAAAVVFLASEGARHITGQSLNVDAGMIWD